jgi:hypothetical protein
MERQLVKVNASKRLVLLSSSTHVPINVRHWKMDLVNHKCYWMDGVISD